MGNAISPGGLKAASGKATALPQESLLYLCCAGSHLVFVEGWRPGRVVIVSTLCSSSVYAELLEPGRWV